MNDLSSSSKGYVQNLAAIALTLDLKDCSDTRYTIGLLILNTHQMLFSLCLSLSELCCCQASTEVMQKQMKLEATTLQENIRHLLLKQSNQKR